MLDTNSYTQWDVQHFQVSAGASALMLTKNVQNCKLFVHLPARSNSAAEVPCSVVVIGKVPHPGKPRLVARLIASQKSQWDFMCNVVSRQQNIQASNLLRVPELVKSAFVSAVLHSMRLLVPALPRLEMITVHFVVILLSKPKRNLLFGNFSSWIRKLAFGNFPVGFGNFPVGFGNVSGWIWKLFRVDLDFFLLEYSTL